MKESCISPKQPYKFLDYYMMDDSDIFFGREREKEILLSDILSTRLVVLFARTGTGKTSLINAGVRPRLEKSGYATFFIRVEKDPIESARAVLGNLYLFCWNDILGNDIIRLIDFLKQNYKVEEIKKEDITKIQDNTIKIINERNSILLKLNDDKTKLYLEIDEGTTEEFNVREEEKSKKLRVYRNLLPYEFCWDDIPGNDDKKLTELLRDRFALDWVNSAEIEKNPDGKVIKVFTEKHFLTLRHNEEKNRVFITIDDGRIERLISRKEYNRFNIYTEGRSFENQLEYIVKKKLKKPVVLFFDQFEEFFLHIKDFLFIWERILGNNRDNEKLIEYLKNNYNINLLEDARIEKTDDGKVIRVADKQKCLTLTLNKDETEAYLDFDDVRIDEFAARKEYDKLGIFNRKKKQFISEIARIYRNRESGVHFVFSMREEFFVNMEEFRDEIPSIFHNDSNLHLRPFNKIQAKEVIVKPADKFGVKIKSELTDKLISDLSDLTLDGSIDPSHLQIVCDTLWREKKDKCIDLSDYQKKGGAREILDHRFIEDIEKQLISKLNWDDIPGKETDRFIQILKENFDADGIEKERIEKSDDKTIRISAKNRSVLLKLNNENTRVNLEIDGERKDVFSIDKENNKLNIFILNYMQLELLKNLLPKLRTDENTKNPRGLSELTKTLNTDATSLENLINKLEEIRLIKKSPYLNTTFVEWTCDYLAERTDFLIWRLTLLYSMRKKAELIVPEETQWFESLTPENIDAIYLTSDDFKEISRIVKNDKELIPFGYINKSEAEFLLDAALYHGEYTDLWLEIAFNSKVDVWSFIKKQVKQKGIKENPQGKNIIKLLFTFINKPGILYPKKPDVFDLLIELSQTYLGSDVISGFRHMRTEEAVDAIKTIILQVGPYSLEAFRALEAITSRDIFIVSWEDVPGKDEKKFITFLKSKFNNDIQEALQIEKTGSGDTIKVHTKLRSFYLKLNDEKTKVSMGSEGISEDLFTQKEKEKYIFCWDEIPGNDSEKLKDFLEQKLGNGWKEKAILKKINSNVIKVTKDNNYLTFSLNEDRTRAYLEIDDIRTEEFIVRTMNKKDNIYEEEKLRVIYPYDDISRKASEALIDIIFNRFEEVFLKALKSNSNPYEWFEEAEKRGRDVLQIIELLGESFQDKNVKLKVQDTLKKISNNKLIKDDTKNRLREVLEKWENNQERTEIDIQTKPKKIKIVGQEQIKYYGLDSDWQKFYGSKDSDSDWQLLINRIKNGKCTPFIGPGIHTERLPAGSKLAEELAEKHHYPLEDYHNLMRVAQFIATTYDDNFLKEDVICRKIKETTESTNDEYFKSEFEPHNFLARLQLPLYITTNYDNSMLRALKLNNRNPSKLICNWNEPHLNNLPESDKLPSKDNPLVFYFHGYFEKPNSIVISEDDYLDFMVAISKNKKLLPPWIEEALSENSLLFLGYSMSDWNFKVIHRILAGYRGLSRSPMNISVQLPPIAYNNDVKIKAVQYLTRYFAQQKIKVFWGSRDEFFQELKKKMEVY